MERDVCGPVRTWFWFVFSTPGGKIPPLLREAENFSPHAHTHWHTHAMIEDSAAWWNILILLYILFSPGWLGIGLCHVYLNGIPYSPQRPNRHRETTHQRFRPLHIWSLFIFIFINLRFWVKHENFLAFSELISQISKRMHHHRGGQHFNHQQRLQIFTF